MLNCINLVFVCVCEKDVFEVCVRKEERGHALRTLGGLYNLEYCPLHSVIFHKGIRITEILCS
jgi:hypothetical protein